MSETPQPRVDVPPARPPVVLRHSVAALRAGESRGSQRSIAVALLANVVVGAAKILAGLVTGSAALLAEAGHSVADSVNELLLGLSLRHARRPADALHPRGHEGARFLWAFLAAISSFLIGGCLSIALAVRELLVGGAVERYLVGWIVLAVAFGAEGISLLQSLALTRREAALWGESTQSFLRHTSEPTLRAIVVEDTAALIGLILAAGGLLLHQFAGLARADAIAALLIGVLLAATAFGLARPLADLLIGRSMLPARFERVYAILQESPSIDEIVSVQAVYGAPQEVIVAAAVHPAPGQTADELAIALDDIDHAMRQELPEVAEVFIDLTSHRAGSAEGQPGSAQQTEDGGLYDESMTPLPPGTPAPDFELPSTPDQKVALAEFRGQPVILAFYPEDWSPVCSDQMALYQEVLPEFRKFNAELLGISVDGVWSHLAFAKDRNLHFPLLADFEPKGEVARAYQVYRAKEGTSERALYVIDADGIVRWSYVSPVGVNPGADGILRALENLGKEGPS